MLVWSVNCSPSSHACPLAKEAILSIWQAGWQRRQVDKPLGKRPIRSAPGAVYLCAIRKNFISASSLLLYADAQAAVDAVAGDVMPRVLMPVALDLPPPRRR